VEVGLDQPGHDRAAVGVDQLDAVRECRGTDCGTGVADPAVLDDNDRITNRFRSGAVDQATVEDAGDSSCDPHD
jgi:hypothetical protein